MRNNVNIVNESNSNRMRKKNAPTRYEFHMIYIILCST